MTLGLEDVNKDGVIASLRGLLPRCDEATTSVNYLRSLCAALNGFASSYISC